MVLIAGVGLGFLGPGDLAVSAALLAVLGRFAGIVFMVEDARGGSGLSLRRGPARRALSDVPRDQFAEPPHEPGVRRQL